MTWPRFGIIKDHPVESFTVPSPDSSTTGLPGFGGGGSTGGAIGNGINNTVNFSNMEVKYYKINLEKTKANIYGESLEKWYYTPVSIKCIIDRGVTSNSDDEFGVNTSQTITISIPRDFAAIYNLLPEVGDIVMDRERYYEINSIDTHFVTIPGLSTPNSTQGTVGETTMYTLSGYLTRITKLNILSYYQ